MRRFYGGGDRRAGGCSKCSNDVCESCPTGLKPERFGLCGLLQGRRVQSGQDGAGKRWQMLLRDADVSVRTARAKRSVRRRLRRCRVPFRQQKGRQRQQVLLRINGGAKSPAATAAGDSGIFYNGRISVPSQFSGAGRPSRNARRSYSFVQLFAMTLRHFRFLSKKNNRLDLNNIFIFSSFRLN